MTYYCNNCGNTDTFRGKQDIVETGYERITFDGSGSNIDVYETETMDSDVQSNPYDIYCEECDSSEVEELDDDEIDVREMDRKRREGIVDEKYAKKVDDWEENLK